LTEIVRDRVTGRLVDPGNAGALAATMREMWSDEELAAQMGVRAWEYARNHFSPRAQAERLAELYERVCLSSSP
jgi:glycosyltransferase involved in cell wall biosynthesis